jgi:hypothetical protein
MRYDYERLSCSFKNYGSNSIDLSKEKMMKNLSMGFALCLMLGLLSVLAVAQEKGKSTVTLEGQVVCSSCWFEADRKVTPYGNEGDLKCAIDCAKKSIFQALAVVGEKETTLYLLEMGKLKRERKDWLDFIAKQVKVTGTVRTDGKKTYLQVDAIELISSEK